MPVLLLPGKRSGDARKDKRIAGNLQKVEQNGEPFRQSSRFQMHRTPPTVFVFHRRLSSVSALRCVDNSLLGPGCKGEQLARLFVRRFLARNPWCNLAKSRKVVGMDVPCKRHVQPNKFAEPHRPHRSSGAQQQPAGSSAARAGGGQGRRKKGRSPLRGESAHC